MCKTNYQQGSFSFIKLCIGLLRMKISDPLHLMSALNQKTQTRVRHLKIQVHNIKISFVYVCQDN